MNVFIRQTKRASTKISQFKDLINDARTRYLLTQSEIVCQGNLLEIYPRERIIYGHLTKYKTQQLRKAAESLRLRCVIRSSYAGDYHLN